MEPIEELQADIIIVGAGASGLMAARVLSAAGKRVSILEARDRVGGRIQTLKNAPFSQPVELGAEFIHGDLEVTLGLLREAGIKYHPAGGKQWQHTNGRLHREAYFAEHWPLLMEKLGELKEDCSLTEFLQEHLEGEGHAAIRRSVIRFAEGFDAAEPDRVSAFALREEWGGEDEAQYRIEGGYRQLTGYLIEQCAGVSVQLSATVIGIQWSPGRVTVHTADGGIYTGGKILITVPLGVLQASVESRAAIRFVPDIPEQQEAINGMGFGGVIKFLLQFREAFWNSDKVKDSSGHSLEKLGFLLSDEAVPTWWTQYPDNNSLLTGWLAGPGAAAMQDLDDEALLHTALESLGAIFDLPVAHLKESLDAWHVANWCADPLSMGGYAYPTVGSPDMRKILSAPVSHTLYFAGEALYEGPSIGTVEAALASGRIAAEKILGS